MTPLQLSRLKSAMNLVKQAKETIQLIDDTSLCQLSKPALNFVESVMEGEVKAYSRQIEHVHVKGNNLDICETCGLDLRDPIHKRL